MYVCSCFGITEQQVREHADEGSCTPRQIASASKAGTDCGSCVRRIQGILGRGCPRSDTLERSAPTLEPAAASPTAPTTAPVTAPAPAPVSVERAAA